MKHLSIYENFLGEEEVNDDKIRQDLTELLSEHINDVFLKAQNAYGATSGDIDPQTSFRLDELHEEIIEMSIQVALDNVPGQEQDEAPRSGADEFATDSPKRPPISGGGSYD